MKMTRNVLLIDDDCGDAFLFQELMMDSPNEKYKIVHHTSVEEALVVMKKNDFDIVFLDLFTCTSCPVPCRDCVFWRSSLLMSFLPLPILCFLAVFPPDVFYAQDIS